MLQKALHKGIIKAVVLVNLRRVPFAEAVGADALIAQVFADDGKLLLDRPFRIESIFNVERVDNASDSIYDIFHDLGNMRSLLPTSMWNNKNLYDAALDKLFSAIIEAGIINYNIACESDSTLTATNYLKRERNY